MPLGRTLEPEVMDSRDEAATYNDMDHSQVNAAFVDALIAAGYSGGDTLDLGTGTALIPIVITRRVTNCRIMAVDMSLSMLDLARYNIEAASQIERIQLAQADAKSLGFSDELFDCVMSNSIIHHLPEPLACLKEVARVCKPNGLLFFRDLMRPPSGEMVDRLVTQYTGNETIPAQILFRESLHAALTLEEIRDLVVGLGFASETVQASSDRHWTWTARKP